MTPSRKQKTSSVKTLPKDVRVPASKRSTEIWARSVKKASEKSVNSHIRKENKWNLHAGTEPVKNVFFKSNDESYRYLLQTQVFIPVAIPIKVAIPSRKRNVMEFIKHSHTFEKT